MYHERLKAVWYRRSDRERTKNHRAVKNFIQTEVVDNVWSRLLPSAKTTICGAWGFDGNIQLVNVGPMKKSEFSGGPGLHNEHGTYLNICIFERNKKGVDTYRWVLAHELAHMFFQSLGSFARAGVLSHDKYRLNNKKKSVTIGDDDADLMNSFQLAAGNGTYFLDHEIQESLRWPFTTRIVERYADAVAIAWGFGFEFAQEAASGGVMDYQDILDTGEGYLLSETALIHEVWNDIKGGDKD